MFGKTKPDPSEIDVQQLVAENDAGGRKPGPLVAKLLLATTLAWSLFQLWIASPLPFLVGVGVFNDTQSRAIHLAFAIFLAFLAYPAFKRSPRACAASAAGLCGRGPGGRLAQGQGAGPGGLQLGAAMAQGQGAFVACAGSLRRAGLAEPCQAKLNLARSDK